MVLQFRVKQVKINLIINKIGNTFFMEDSWLKKGDFVINKRTRNIHKVTINSRNLVQFSNDYDIEVGDKLFSLFTKL